MFTPFSFVSGILENISEYMILCCFWLRGGWVGFSPISGACCGVLMAVLQLQSLDTVSILELITILVGILQRRFRGLEPEPQGPIAVSAQIASDSCCCQQYQIHCEAFSITYTPQ